MPWVLASEDYGVVLGAGTSSTKFGFRKHPFAARQTLRVGYSTRLGTGGVEYEYDSLRTDNRARFHVLARASALRLIHYYGFGNETTDDAPQERLRREADAVRARALLPPRPGCRSTSRSGRS